MTLADFLLARIAEDEQVGCICRLGWIDRVEVEVEAKRRIVAERTDDEPPWIVLRHMAAVYADHPDYREEWTA